MPGTAKGICSIRLGLRLSNNSKFRPSGRGPKAPARLSLFDQHILGQLHNSNCILERHEEKIAHHTTIQSWIAFFQLIFGIITTGLLIYVAILQFRVSNQQADSQDRQVKLEYAKVAPQFDVRANYFPLHASEASKYPFPQGALVRIIRGEASLQSVDATEEIKISHLINGQNYMCIIRLHNYFLQKSGNVTDFSAAPVMSRISSDPSWFEDKEDTRFTIVEASQTLITVKYKDIFGNEKLVRFSGNGSSLSQIPSGGFSRNEIWETVDGLLASPDRFSIPGSVTPVGPAPKTASCKLILGRQQN